ncbi:hypothetical protein ASPZODRAFT_117065 [Penicilliopsis zonata CBS 506.65]|uniref:Alpha/beta hydrolase fold-3 domain-containing protein n=1 Tax=Penicilliopsis zonata CBS 506.65 TaxID=1073090 RepID=A0A1L9SH77_9EURO|nr:hypothetical protein ASPZODRAFT_117065 [Penicilliopsis zonata CBS 506.65]OJJ46518.1 hypothetical protein ASPZODRAFT_117065 [Penicilliopsis zonata CBS 506.65]
MHQHTISTRTYKTVHDKPIQADVYTVDTAQPSPVLLWFHGGYIITGDRTAIPAWLVNAAFTRRWTIVSADYRCLPESTGLDLIQDLCDAYRYAAEGVSKDFPSVLVDKERIIVAGGSGGGYCVELLGSQTQIQKLDPPPAALFALYPMSNPASETWTFKGLKWEGSELSASQTAETAVDIARRQASPAQVSFGEAFPKDDNMDTHARWNTLRYILEQALFVDYLTGVKGLGAKIAAEGVAAVPPHLQILFPTHFSITKLLPPLVVVHGTGDRDVPVTDGEAWVEKCRQVGATVAYYPVQGMEHGFDLGYKSFEDGDLGDDGGKIALAESLKQLDRWLVEVTDNRKI